MVARKKKAAVTCYHCGSPIKYDSDLVLKQIPLACKDGKKRMYTRKFHMDCLKKFLKNTTNHKIQTEEGDDWDAAYKYFKDTILEIPDSKPMPPFATKRLLGLRVGQYMPNGNNVRGIERGYSYKTILYALKVSHFEIEQYTQGKEFENVEHHVNYIFKIIEKNLPEVDRKLRKLEKAQEQTRKIEVKRPIINTEYIVKSGNRGKARFSGIE
jgi:CCR4-NOT transcriptional regulation complex NOT5 subunit